MGVSTCHCESVAKAPLKIQPVSFSMPVKVIEGNVHHNDAALQPK
jgi:hypothetical protein